MTDAIAVLRNLLENESLWLDSVTAGQRIDPTSADPKAVASQARRAREIFSAWDGDHYHYPAFQFDPVGGPRPKTRQLIEVLPKERDGSVGIEAALWILWPDHAFDRKSPADVFPLDPDRVINEARIRLDGGRD